MPRVLHDGLLAWAVITMTGPAHATLISAEPDDFAVGTVVVDTFPGLSLAVEGRPGSGVQVLDGFSPFNGRNLATTGSSVFGQLPRHSADVPQGWDALNGLLRLDFAAPTDFVQIDLIFDDDDFGRLSVFDNTGSLLDSVFVTGDGRGPTAFQTATVSRPSADIAYALAGGDLGEALFLDNLQYNFLPLAEPSTTGIFLIGLAGIGFIVGRRRTACKTKGHNE